MRDSPKPGAFTHRGGVIGRPSMRRQSSGAVGVFIDFQFTALPKSHVSSALRACAHQRAARKSGKMKLSSALLKRQRGALRAHAHARAARRDIGGTRSLTTKYSRSGRVEDPLSRFPKLPTTSDSGESSQRARAIETGEETNPIE